jgi:putative membrane protein
VVKAGENLSAGWTADALLAFGLAAVVGAAVVGVLEYYTDSIEI